MGCWLANALSFNTADGLKLTIQRQCMLEIDAMATTVSTILLKGDQSYK